MYLTLMYNPHPFPTLLVVIECIATYRACCDQSASKPTHWWCLRSVLPISFWAVKRSSLSDKLLYSVMRVSKQVNKCQPLAYKAFTTITYTIPHQSAKKDMHTLFDVLEGKADIEATLPLCEKQHSALLEYAKSHSPATWNCCTHWVKWWRRDRHLSKCCALIFMPYMWSMREQCSPHSLGH